MVDPVEHRLKHCNQLRGRDSTIPGQTVSIWRGRRRIEPTSLDQDEPDLGVEQSRPSRQRGDGIGEGPQQVTRQHDIKAPVGQVRSRGITNMELDRQSGEARLPFGRLDVVGFAGVDASAMRRLLEQGLVAEPAGAAGVAALLRNPQLGERPPPFCAAALFLRPT